MRISPRDWRRGAFGAFALAALALACTEGRAEEPIVGLPCDGCEAVFQGLPAQLASTARIAPASEPGERLVIEGTVRGADGTPRPGIVVYAYHTDAGGIYPRAENPPGAEARRHGRLRGWAATDASGAYRFDTIRPGGYPNSGIPQHVHMLVIEPGRCAYYIDDLLFDDDTRLTAGERARLQGRGGPGIVQPSRDATGSWHARRDIVLGERIRGYGACDRPAAAPAARP